MGAGGQMVPIEVLSAPGGAPGGTLAYAPDGLRLTKTATGTVTPILVKRLANLTLFASSGGAGDELLGPLVAGSPATANADTGAIVTGVPTATQHGIPTNFGPGRGNWTQDDLLRTRVYIQRVLSSPSVALGPGTVSIAGRNLVGNDLVIQIRNNSATPLLALVLDIEWRHSIQVA